MCGADRTHSTDKLTAQSPLMLLRRKPSTWGPNPPIRQGLDFPNSTVRQPGCQQLRTSSLSTMEQLWANSFLAGSICPYNFMPLQQPLNNNKTITTKAQFRACFRKIGAVEHCPLSESFDWLTSTHVFTSCWLLLLTKEPWRWAVILLRVPQENHSGWTGSFHWLCAVS